MKIKENTMLQSKLVYFWTQMVKWASSWFDEY